MSSRMEEALPFNYLAESHPHSPGLYIVHNTKAVVILRQAVYLKYRNDVVWWWGYLIDAVDA